MEISQEEYLDPSIQVNCSVIKSCKLMAFCFLNVKSYKMKTVVWQAENRRNVSDRIVACLSNSIFVAYRDVCASIVACFINNITSKIHYKSIRKEKAIKNAGDWKEGDNLEECNFFENGDFASAIVKLTAFLYAPPYILMFRHQRLRWNVISSSEMPWREKSLRLYFL